MNRFYHCAVVAFAAVGAQSAQAAVTVDGFTLDTGTFGAQTGVHSTGSQSGSSIAGYVNQDNSAVTFSTTTGNLSITGSGQATIAGDPLIENLAVTFAKAWDNITFNFAGATGTFALLVNGDALFSATPNSGDAVCTICLIGNGNNQFTVSGSGITSLAFTFNPGVSSARQFRVEGVSAIPETATWAAMIAGFCMVGFSMRRNRSTRVYFA